MDAMTRLKYFSIGTIGLAFMALCFDVFSGAEGPYGFIALLLCIMAGGFEIVRHIFKKMLVEFEALKK